MKTISFHTDTEYCTISTPLWGYETEIHMAMKMARDPYSGDVKTWDNGQSYDHRIVNARWLLTQTQADNLNDFLANADQGRIVSYYLTPSSGAGCYLFGPDIGNVNFLVNEIENSRSGRLHRPFNYFEFNMSLLMIDKGSYTLPVQVSEGSTEIGTITGLPFIKDVNLTHVKGWSTGVSAGGTPISLSLGPSGEYTDAVVSFEVNQSNAAALINHLVTTVRGGTFQITAQENTYLFGAENGAAETYNCQLIDNIIKVVHGNVNKFKITLNIHMVSILS